MVINSVEGWQSVETYGMLAPASIVTGAVKRSKVQPITPHDLRHTCASLTISAGANVLALARLLEHKDTKETLNTYADLFDDDLDKLANAMDAALRAGRVCPRCAHSAENGASYGIEKAPHLRKQVKGLWRWRRDLNPRRGVTPHTLSRRAP